MVIPAIVDIAVGHPDWQVFLVAAGVTLFVGVSMMLTTRASLKRFSVRQAFLLTNLAWLVIVVFGALPFQFSELKLDPVDALFESVSGVTTTGATVIVGLDRSEEHTSELQSLMRISYAVFCLQKKTTTTTNTPNT